MTGSLIFSVDASGALALVGEYAADEDLQELESDALEDDVTNPILPTGNELFYGALFFLLLWALMKWVLVPPVSKTMSARAEKVREDNDTADAAAIEAERLEVEHRQALQSAHAEATRILEDARHAADDRRRVLVEQAEGEIAQLREQAQAEVDAAKDRAFEELRSGLADLAIEAAELVVQHDLDRSAQLPLVERYVNDVGSRN